MLGNHSLVTSWLFNSLVNYTRCNDEGLPWATGRPSPVEMTWITPVEMTTSTRRQNHTSIENRSRFLPSVAGRFLGDFVALHEAAHRAVLRS